MAGDIVNKTQGFLRHLRAEQPVWPVLPVAATCTQMNYDQRAAPPAHVHSTNGQDMP